MKKFIPFIVLALICALSLSAQQYLNQSILQSRPRAKKITYWDVKRAFETYWQDKTPSNVEGENAEEGGWQQFKRWEWFVKPRTFPGGEFPNSEILYNEYQNYKKNYTQNNSGRNSAPNWTFIGPGVVPGNGGGAGRINCIAFDPGNSNIIWIGAACGGLWKSTDGGATWNSNTDLLPALSISEIVIDPNNSQNMYLATGDKYGVYFQYEVWGHYSAGVLKSTDGGVTWNSTGMNYTLADNILVQRLILDSNSPNTLFAATNQGIYQTTNGGTSWNNIRGGSFYDIEFNSTNHSIIYAGDATGVLRSADGGSTWNYATGVTASGRTSIAVTDANANAVYAFTESGGFFYSNNSGVSFTARMDASAYCGPYGYYDMILEVSPVNENVIFTGGLDVARSTDGGNTWTKVSDWGGWPNPNYVHADNHAQMFLPGSNTTIFSCNDGGIFKSTDQGNTWTDLSSGLDIKQYYRLGSSYLTPTLIYAGAQDNGTDRVSGISTATQVNGADGEECLVDFTDDNIVFVSSQGGYFLKSTDGGNSFFNISTWGCDWTSPIIMDPTNHNVMYMGSGAVEKSDDNGNTWNTLTGPFDGSCMYSLEICSSSPNYLYAATFGNIYRTTNGGTNWSTITGTLPVSSAAISGITINSANPDAAWVTFSGFSNGNKVFYSNDGGASWSNVSGTLPNIPVNCIEYQDGSNDLLYIGTDLGVFYTDGTLNDWLPYNTGLPNVIIDELEVYYPTSKLRAATFGRGLWESDLQVSTLYALDASAMSMVYPPVNTCDTVIVPIVRIRNAGTNTINSVELHYHMDSQSDQMYNWSGTLSSLATADITLPTYTLAGGSHTLYANTANPNSSADMNPLNDNITRMFSILSNPSSVAPNFTEGFVSTTFPPANWNLVNSSGLLSRSTTAGGYGLSSESAKADFYSVTNGTGELMTPYIDFTNASAPLRIKFDLAYAMYNVSYIDSLIIDLYDDCNPNPKRIYAKDSYGLETAPMTTNDFVPASNEWKTETLNLDTLAGYPSLRIRFIAKSGYGNNLYIDNINMSGIVGINNEENESYLKMFPNPSAGILNIEMTSRANDKITITIFDVMGRIMKKTEGKAETSRHTMSLNISDLSEGIYFVRVQRNDSITTEKVAVIK